MYLRTFSVATLLLLAGCGGPLEGVAPSNAQEAGNGTPAAAPAEHIACALGGADYADVCTVERAATATGMLLTIRHPDGGFRRLRLSSDGRDVAVADGAMPAQVVSRSGTGIEVAIGDARYRLPPTR